MNKYFSWWYIPIIFFGALFVLYIGLIGYRLAVADSSKENNEDVTESNDFWSNIGETIGIGNRRLKGEREGRVNVLLVGVAGGDNVAPDLTDTIIFTSTDTNNHEIDMFSIPRDLYLEIPGFGYNKINAAYSLGKNYDSAGGGIETLEDTVTKVVGQPVDYYVKIDFDGFVEAVDLLGGVDVVVEKDIYDYLYPDGYGGYQIFALTAGPQHLDGETALMYARSRQTTSDFDRARRQQQIMWAMKDAFLSKGLVEGGKILIQMIDVVSEHLETNFKIWEWERIAKIIKDWGSDVSINNFVFDNTLEGMLMDSSVDGAYVLEPQSGDFDEIQQFVTDQIGTIGKKEDEIISFEVLNATNRIGLATGVADELKIDENEVVNVGNDDEKEETIVYCTKDKLKLAKTYLLGKWDYIKNFETITEKANGADCQLVLGKDFEL
jgi:LCP family protein required for cell wall assembly